MMTWGKYKGQKVHDILKQDPDYLKWCVLNIWTISIKIKSDLDKAYKSKFGVTLTKLRADATALRNKDT